MVMDLRCLTPFVYQGQQVVIEAGRQLAGTIDQIGYRLIHQIDGTTSLNSPRLNKKLRPGATWIADSECHLSWKSRATILRIGFDLFPRERTLYEGLWQPDNHNPQPPLNEVFGDRCDGSFPNILGSLARTTAWQLAKMQPKSEVSVLRANAMLHTLLAAYASYYNNTTVSKGSAPSFNAQVEEFLLRNFAEGTSIADAADYLGITAVHLSQRYKSITGISPKTFLQRQRISHAQTLLIYHDMSITEVAKAVGYRRLDSFRASFVKETGMSPLRWRQSMRDDRANEDP